MKLLFCERCGDMFKLRYKERACECGLVKGRYIDNTNAVTNGKGISVAIGNGSFKNAIKFMKMGDQRGHRDDYIDNCNIEYAWVRPNDGPGNPHTQVVPDFPWKEEE